MGAAGRGPMNPQQNAFGDTFFVISGSFPWKSTEPNSLGAFLGVGGLLFGNELSLNNLKTKKHLFFQ